MIGDNIRILENLILVEGMIPRSILIEPDIANAVVYKKDDTVYLIDSGATLEMRAAIRKAAESLRPFERVVLLNSHAHPDHTANNAIIGEIEALEKQHFISAPGIAAMDFESYFIDKYGSLNRYYNYLDGPRFPVSIFSRGMKLISRFNPDAAFLMVKKSLKKFMPFDTSVATARAFEEIPSQQFSGSLAGCSGWKMDDSILALETRGHSPDHISFYIPEEKALILADETFPFFNCWADSNSCNVERILELSIEMTRRGDVEVLIGGHDHEILRGAMIEPHLNEIMSGYRQFRAAVLDIVGANAGGQTVNAVYSRLRKVKNSPVLRKYFALEFPKMPPMLKTVITALLLEAGCEVDGPEGRAVFRISK